ncbi:hypothetical protein PMKS-003567 [Pichia membranifaciens]|uniref:Uncharacterized protein n=1 Tax=Pichia membranifaciens TaxID=4926 RepID=A0A1Q2YKQ0_9ASCO|nr:hypothetical protein PMKS-003567 [Pichia membranifaciens]
MYGSSPNDEEDSVSAARVDRRRVLEQDAWLLDSFEQQQLDRRRDYLDLARLLDPVPLHQGGKPHDARPQGPQPQAHSREVASAAHGVQAELQDGVQHPELELFAALQTGLEEGGPQHDDPQRAGGRGCFEGPEQAEGAAESHVMVALLLQAKQVQQHHADRALESVREPVQQEEVTPRRRVHQKRAVCLPAEQGQGRAAPEQRGPQVHHRGHRASPRDR